MFSLSKRENVGKIQQFETEISLVYVGTQEFPSSMEECRKPASWCSVWRKEEIQKSCARVLTDMHSKTGQTAPKICRSEIHTNNLNRFCFQHRRKVGCSKLLCMEGKLITEPKEITACPVAFPDFSLFAAFLVSSSIMLQSKIWFSFVTVLFYVHCSHHTSTCQESWSGTHGPDCLWAPQVSRAFADEVADSDL